MRITKAILLVMILFVGPRLARAQVPGANLLLAPDNLHFRYESFDGSVQAACTHALESAASQDWAVHCEDSKGLEREYRVHLWITEYTHSESPKMSLEILYWVTPLGSQAAAPSSSTIWLHFAEPSAPVGFSLAQGLENDTAGLYLDIHLASGPAVE
jgi:hypothetical protein